LSWYLDTSVLVPLHVPEPSSDVVTSVFSASEHDFIVSTLAAGEFASSVSRRVRMKEATSDTAIAWLTQFDEWANEATIPVKVENGDIAKAASLVRQFELRLLMPDAIHVSLCLRHQLALVTLDERLADAARLLGIEVVWPE
jgi:uncharacterized protein